MRINVIVEQVLRDKPETRDSDKKLIVEVWERLGFFLSEQQKVKFYNLPSTESIRRVRQRIQELGQYKASDGVARERRVKGYIMQQNAPAASPKRTEQLLTQAAMPWLEEDN